MQHSQPSDTTRKAGSRQPLPSTTGSLSGLHPVNHHTPLSYSCTVPSHLDQATYSRTCVSAADDYLTPAVCSASRPHLNLSSPSGVLIFPLGTWNNRMLAPPTFLPRAHQTTLLCRHRRVGAPRHGRAALLRTSTKTGPPFAPPARERRPSYPLVRSWNRRAPAGAPIRRIVHGLRLCYRPPLTR